MSTRSVSKVQATQNRVGNQKSLTCKIESGSPLDTGE